MSKKVISISTIVVVSIYALCAMIGIIIGVSEVCAPSVLFTSVLALLSVLCFLPSKYRKTRVCCIVLGTIAFLCALVLFIMPFFTLYRISDKIGLIFSVLLLGINIGQILVETDNALFITKITSSVCAMILVLLTLMFREDAVIAVPINLACSAIAVNLLAPKLRDKKVQKIVSVSSCVLLIMPIIYLCRGYFGVNAVMMKVFAICAILITLASTIIGAYIMLKKPMNKNVSETPAPVATTEVALNDIWECSSCGTSGNEGDFCENCGAKKFEYWFCTSCGTKNHKQFCGKCGHKKEM